MTIMMKLAVLSGIAVFCADTLPADEPSRPVKQQQTLESLKAEIDALKPANVAWREIQWKSCLLEGLKESRETSKPALLWIFIDRPFDDARC
jgi:hypothetical protein